MQGYGQFCPVAVACEVFAERWTPLILRELLAGSRRFSEIRRGMPLISRALLAQRLRALEDAGVIKSRPRARGRGREYGLTASGEEFRTVITSLGEWGQRWTIRVSARNLDAGFLMWDVQRRIAVDRLPSRRVTIRFDFRRLPLHHRGASTFWLVLDEPEVDLCVKDPGFEVDLVVTADLATFVKVWLGDAKWSQALSSGAVRLEGVPQWIRAFPAWLLLGGFAGIERPRRLHAS